MKEAQRTRRIIALYQVAVVAASTALIILGVIPWRSLLGLEPELRVTPPVLSLGVFLFALVALDIATEQLHRQLGRRWRERLLDSLWELLLRRQPRLRRGGQLHYSGLAAPGCWAWSRCSSTSRYGAL